MADTARDGRSGAESNTPYEGWNLVCSRNADLQNIWLLLVDSNHAYLSITDGVTARALRLAGTGGKILILSYFKYEKVIKNKL
jgi:hypothetical protein